MSTFSSYVHVFLVFPDRSHHEKNQTTYPKAFQRFHNYTQNICGEVDEKSHPYWLSPYLQHTIFQTLSVKKWDESTAYIRETLHAVDESAQ